MKRKTYRLNLNTFANNVLIPAGVILLMMAMMICPSWA